jgi:hypothetical protein
MAESTKSSHQKTREARLRAALRDNLKRRKAQAKARSGAQAKADSGGETPNSAGIVTDKHKG